MKPWFLLLPFLVLTAAPLRAGERPLPAAVQDYYRTYSFICAVSTDAERVRLSGPGYLTVPLGEERLHEVRGKMDELDGRLWRPDPGILPSGPVPRVYTGLQTVVSVVQAAPRELVLEVLVERLSAEQNTRLIRLYEQQKLSGRDWEGSLGGGRAESRHLEYHHWRLLGGSWYRDEMAWILTR